MRKQVAAAWAVVAVVSVQIAVPTVAFMDEPPTRFGFQMYSGLGGVDVQVTGSDGEVLAVDWPSVLAGSRRPELDWTQHLPEHLCQEVAGAHTVMVAQAEQRREILCS